MEKICFLSSLPDIQSAINISGTGNGVRLKLDVPETAKWLQVIKLALRGKPLKVTQKKLVKMAKLKLTEELIEKMIPISDEAGNYIETICRASQD